MLGIQHYIIYRGPFLYLPNNISCITKCDQSYFPKGFLHDVIVTRICVTWSLGLLYMGIEMTKTMVLDRYYNYHLPHAAVNYVETVQKKQQMDINPTGRQWRC